MNSKIGHVYIPEHHHIKWFKLWDKLVPYSYGKRGLIQSFLQTVGWEYNRDAFGVKIK